MSAKVGVWPWQKVPVSGSLARRCSSACRPVPNHWICQARQAASSKPPTLVRYFFTRGVMSGWVSAASRAASERTRARPCASAGSKAGVGWVSSMNSRMASDCVMGVCGCPGAWSISAGIAPIGLSRR